MLNNGVWIDRDSTQLRGARHNYAFLGRRTPYASRAGRYAQNQNHRHAGTSHGIARNDRKVDRWGDEYCAVEYVARGAWVDSPGGGGDSRSGAGSRDSCRVVDGYAGAGDSDGRFEGGS